MNGRFFGLDGVRCAEGEDADDVWRQLHDLMRARAPTRSTSASTAREGASWTFFPNGYIPTDIRVPGTRLQAGGEGKAR